jgi:hypothetical protein
VISFRYYLITIVAIFLALGLGVLAGSTVLDQGLVNSLQGQTDRLQADLGDLRKQVVDLRGRVDRANQFADAALPVLARGRLSLRPVVVVTDQGGIDGGSSDHAIAALKAAGADLVAELRIDPRMAATTPQSRQSLAEVLGEPASTPSRQLSTRAASVLARRLALGQQRAASDVLGKLIDAGFVTNLTNTTLGTIGGGSSSVVVVHGGTREQQPAPEDFLIPFVDDAVGSEKLDVAATEGLASQPQFVEALRGSNALSGDQYVTVDDVDQGIGQVALAVGLQRLIDLGEGGDYGMKANATVVVPPLDAAA